jgi:hypothetical protein
MDASVAKSTCFIKAPERPVGFLFGKRPDRRPESEMRKRRIGSGGTKIMLTLEFEQRRRIRLSKIMKNHLFSIS